MRRAPVNCGWPLGGVRRGASRGTARLRLGLRLSLASALRDPPSARRESAARRDPPASASGSAAPAPRGLNAAIAPADNHERPLFPEDAVDHSHPEDDFEGYAPPRRMDLGARSPAERPEW